MVIAVPAQTVWSSVPLVSAKVEIGFTVIVPLSDMAVQGAVWPLVVTVYVPLEDGMPLIVTVLAVVMMAELKPVGKPLTEALVALPP